MSVLIRGKNPRRPYTIRYWVDGRQREKSFKTAAEARDFRIKADHDLRAKIFVDDKLGRQLFGEAAEAWLAGLALSPRSVTTYTEVWAKHLEPVLANRTLTDVARNRDDVTQLLTSGTVGALSVSRRSIARRVITGVLDEAVRSGKIASHRLGDIELGRNVTRNEHTDFVFPSYAQITQVAEATGICVWLMRGCGLRIEEALAVERDDFREDGTVLRVRGQASRDGRIKVPLKHRNANEWRDIPVPAWLRMKVRNLPAGPLQPGRNRHYKAYRTTLDTFTAAAAGAGIPSTFTPHSLRHAYASTLLARGIPISDIAVWLGHRSINTTFGIYGHLVPSAAGRAMAALDAEYSEWTAEDS